MNFRFLQHITKGVRNFRIHKCNVLNQCVRKLSKVNAGIFF